MGDGADTEDMDGEAFQIDASVSLPGRVILEGDNDSKDFAVNTGQKIWNFLNGK